MARCEGRNTSQTLRAASHIQMQTGDGRVLSLRNELAKWLTNPLVASRALVVFLVATVTVFGNSTGSFPPIGDVNLPVLYGLARWDSGYYLGIATDGYAIFQHGYSFRPLFPLAIRALYPAFPWLDVRSAEVLAGFLWNLVAVGIAAFYLERLTKQLLGPAIASSTLLLLAVYPSTFFFSVIYSEATCILFITTSLYYLESRRILLAGGLGFLAGLARPEAFLVAIPFLVKTLFEDQKLRKLTAGLVVLASVPAFAAYGYLQTGNLFAVLQSEITGPKCNILCFISNPVFNLANYFLPYTINFAVFTIAVIFVVYPLLRANTSSRIFPYYLWAFILLAIVFYSGDARSLARFALVVPPVFWAQAEYSLNHPRFFQALVVVYAVMMSLATILFVNWYPML